VFCSVYIVACFASVNFEATQSTLPNFYHQYSSQPSGRVGFTTFTFNNNFYLTGGFPNVNGDTYACNDLWSTPMLGVVNFTQVATSLPFSSRWAFQVMTFGSLLIFVGGSPSNQRPSTSGVNQALSDIWISTNAVNWTLSSSTIPVARAGYYTANISGAWYYYGGWDNIMGATGDMYNVYTSTNGVNWGLVPNTLPFDEETFSSAVFNNKVYLIGGFYSFYVSLNPRYFVTSNFVAYTSIALPTAIVARAGASAVVFNNMLYLIFGFDATYTTIANVFSTSDGLSFQSVCNTTVPCAMNARGYAISTTSTVSALNTNHIFILGGFTGTASGTSMTSSYDIWHYGELNDCIGINCQNGTCVDGILTYTCNCNAGYNGTYCNNVINNCASGPCYNGATCINQVNSYNCTCASGYTGTYCQTKSSASTITVSFALVIACALLSSFLINGKNH